MIAGHLQISGGVESVIQRTCKCGVGFMAKPFEVKRGRGIYCSLSCAASVAATNRDQRGEKNPNWRSGSTPYREAKRVYRARHPQKAAAHMKVRDAVSAGLLAAQPCEGCGDQKVHAHHDDYAQPLVVRWLCKRCHEAHHVAMRAAGIERYAQQE